MYVCLTVQLGQISSSLVCRWASMASATSSADRRCCEEGRIGLMITSTRVKFVREDTTSCFCFTTRILERFTEKNNNTRFHPC